MLFYVLLSTARRFRSYLIWLNRFSVKVLIGFELATDVRFDSLVLAAVRLLAKKLSSCFFWLSINICDLFALLVRFCRFCCICRSFWAF